MNVRHRWNPLSWPLKRQIRLLSVMVVVMVVLSIALGVVTLRQRQSARVADAAAHLKRLTAQLVVHYMYLRASVDEHHGPELLASSDDQILRSVTESVLALAAGVEGGFYAVSDHRLLGYGYPTYQGSGPKIDIPSAERPAIMRVVETAVERRAATVERVAGGSDIILFHARPIPDHGAALGAVWTMQRVNGARTTGSRLYGPTMTALLVIAALVATVAWRFTHRLDRGVERLQAGLRTMAERIDTPLPPVGIPELERVGASINELAHAVVEHQRERSALEQRLHRSDRLAALGRLVGAVAHEVRNPLASIKLKLHLARGLERDPDRVAATFDVIETEVERLDRLVERLLTLAKPAEPARVPTDLARLLGSRMELWTGRAAASCITLDLQTAPEAEHPVMVDADRVVQIVDNLIANAMDALRSDGGRVIVEMTRPSPVEIIIAVNDTGPGVPHDDLGRLFEPFFTTREDGTGLGLFLSAELARGVGGELSYSERPGGGARFILRLPC